MRRFRRSVTYDELPSAMPAPVRLQRRRRAKAARAAAVAVARVGGAVLLLLAGFAAMHLALSVAEVDDCCTTATHESR